MPSSHLHSPCPCQSLHSGNPRPSSADRRITLPSPYDRVHASVDDEAINAYDSTDSAQNLDEWLAEVGRSVSEE